MFFYKIYNKDKNITYNGVIDVTLNKVIFNTKEQICKMKKPAPNVINGLKYCLLAIDNLGRRNSLFRVTIA